MTGEELKKRRTELSMTQEELAYALGVRQNTVARWESGNYRIPFMVGLAIESVERAKETVTNDKS